jgi:predicted RNase H-like nuclease (RuvC/YqgF family)
VVVDRRSPSRHVVDTHLDDLQSELEAGARIVQQVQDDAGRMDAVLRDQFPQVTPMDTLIRRISELKKRVAYQLASLKELREEFQTLRQIYHQPPEKR